MRFNVAFEIASLRESEATVVEGAYKWSLLSVRSDMVEEFVQVVYDHATTLLLLFQAFQLVPAFEESMVLLLLVFTPQVIEQVILEGRDYILEAESCRIEMLAMDYGYLVRRRYIVFLYKFFGENMVHLFSGHRRNLFLVHLYLLVRVIVLGFSVEDLQGFGGIVDQLGDLEVELDIVLDLVEVFYGVLQLV